MQGQVLLSFVIQVLNAHEEDLMFVLGNVPLESYRMGAFVDMCNLVPTPHTALQRSQRLLQVSLVIFPR